MLLLYVCLCVTNVSIVSRRQCCCHWNYSYRFLWAFTWVLVIRPGFFGEQQVLFSAGLSLPPQFGLENFIHNYRCFYLSLPPLLYSITCPVSSLLLVLHTKSLHCWQHSFVHRATEQKQQPRCISTNGIIMTMWYSYAMAFYSSLKKLKLWKCQIKWRK